MDTNNGLLNSLSGLALWDQETALNRMGFKEGLLSKVINMFLADLPQQQATIEQAIKVHDYDTAAKMAHSIKGSSASIGADRLSLVTKQLEASCKNKHSTVIEAIIVNFEIECQALQECLIKHVE
jgi:HPt (histidine-containing phosphotransfer) domain-containing protein